MYELPWIVLERSMSGPVRLNRVDFEAKTIRLSFALKAGIEDIEETFENGYVPLQYKTPLNISRAAARIITNFELKSTYRVSTRTKIQYSDTEIRI